jgi:archaellum biogenesis ATPase FlaH
VNGEQIVSAIIADRAAYDRLAGRLDPSDFDEFGKLVVKAAHDYYARDPGAGSVELAVLDSALRRAIPNPKQADNVAHYLRDLPHAGSPANIADEYRLLRRYNVGLSLAAELASGGEQEGIDGLLEKYRELGVEQENDQDKLTLEELMETVGEGNQIPVLPSRLNVELDGGVLRGHSIVIYGRPESGKTAFAVNMCAGFLQSGLRVLYTGNEEPLRDLQLRFISRLSGVGLSEIKADPEVLRAAVLSDEARPYEGLLAKHLSTGKVAEVESIVRRKAPDVLVIDQIKNLTVPGVTNRADCLDQVAGAVRRIGIAYNLVTVMVTQAGDSADGSLMLEQGDVEWSNTGVPGAADLMIGVGVNREYDQQNKRMISLPKNKISGKHPSFNVWTDFAHSKILSTPPASKRNYR